jgi:hypothetical protein
VRKRRENREMREKQTNVIEGERCREIREIFVGKSENTIEEKQLRGLIKKNSNNLSYKYLSIICIDKTNKNIQKCHCQLGEKQEQYAKRGHHT